MNKAILVFTFLTVFLNFTNLSAQTTLTEYNYVSKALSQDLNNGRDIKSGYILKSTGISEKLQTPDGVWRNAKIYYFNSKYNNKTQAFAVECSDSFGNSRFMCIPINGTDSTLWDLAYQEFYNTGSEWHRVFMWALIKLTSNKLS